MMLCATKPKAAASKEMMKKISKKSKKERMPKKQQMLILINVCGYTLLSCKCGQIAGNIITCMHIYAHT